MASSIAYLVIAVGSVCVLAVIGDQNVTVEFPDFSSMASSTCTFPGHMRVEIKTDSDTIVLNLIRKQSDPRIYVPRTDKSGKVVFIRQYVHEEMETALYQGDQAEFQVTCNKENKLILNGTIEHADGRLYSLEPLGPNNMYTLVEEPLDKSDLDDDESGDTESSSLPSVPRRFKREITEDIYIDVMALIEHSVYLRWFARATAATDEDKKAETLDTIRRHFVHIFNAVDIRFKTASPFLNIDLVGFMIEDIESGSWFESVRSAETNQSIIDSGKLLNTQYDLSQTAGFPAHDHLVSFTAMNIYAVIDGVAKDSVAGLAKVGQICKSETAQSGSICEYQDSFIKDVRIAAHEIGHCLSARHDGSDGNTCDPADTFIMAPSLALVTSTNPFAFSTCSADYFNDHITGLLASGDTFPRECFLKSLARDGVPDVGGEFHGQLYDVNEQCQLTYGPDASHCKGIDISTTNVCQKLYCYKSVGASTCARMYAAPGTTCGDKAWCINGECVYSLDAPPADPDCLFGDTVGLLSNGMTCSQLITSASSCTSSTNRRYCCASCKPYYPAPCSLTCEAPLVVDEKTCECTASPRCILVKANGLCSTYWGSACPNC